MATQNTPNPKKRGAPDANASQPAQKPTTSLSHARKRVKLQDARTIAVQSTEGALRGGQLDINAFVKSREFEISALKDAIASSKYSFSRLCIFNHLMVI